MPRAPRLDSTVAGISHPHDIAKNVNVKDNSLGMSQKCSKMSPDWIEGSFTICSSKDAEKHKENNLKYDVGKGLA
jgi:hypothetical protein